MLTVIHVVSIVKEEESLLKDWWGGFLPIRFAQKTTIKQTVHEKKFLSFSIYSNIIMIHVFYNSSTPKL